MPCTADLTPAASTGVGHVVRSRQLESTGTGVKQKYKCKFDSASPLNVSDLSTAFIVECEQIVGPPDYTWSYICLGIVGGGFGICFLAYCLPRCIPSTQARMESLRAKRRERQEQRAIAEAQAMMQAKLEAPAGGHPYERA